MARKIQRDQIVRIAALFGAGVFAAGLALFAYAGTYSRFWADDYCYSATIKQLGLFRGLADWYLHNGNRLSTLAVVDFSDIFGWKGIQFIPLAVLLVWVGAWVFFLDQLFRLLHWKVAGYWLVLLSLIQVYFVTLLAPDRLQTIYWRMGTYHYSLPMPLLLINLGLLALWFRSSAKPRIWMILMSGFLGLFAAGLSETFAALQTGILLTAILAALVFLRAPRLRAPRLSQAVWLLAPPLIGTLITMIIMMRAPANAWRQAVMPPPDNLLLIIPYSLRFAADFILYTIRGQITPFLVYILGLGVIAVLLVPADNARLSLHSLLIGVAAVLLGMYAWIVCSFAPSAFAGLAYPAGRALMPGCFALLTGLGLAAFLGGIAVRQLIPTAGYSWLGTAALILLVLFNFYPFRAASVAQHDIAQLSVKAARWDTRHNQIMNSAAVGKLDVQVKQVDVVQSLEDMGPNSNNWINACAALLYGVHSITANP